MKNIWTVSLTAGVVLPLVLLLWPFAAWGPAASLLLRVAAAACAQGLFCMLPKGLKTLPFVGTLCLALWGTWLYCTSPHWSNATFGGLVADYVSPAISCVVVFVIWKLKK